MRCTNKIILLFCLLALCIPIAYAVKPGTGQTANIGEGFDLTIPIREAVTVNQTLQINIHVYNISTGLPIVSGIVCQLHIYNQTAKHIVEIRSITPDHTYDYEFKIHGNNFTNPGIYPYVVSCNNSIHGGFFKDNFEVTYSGHSLSIEKATSEIGLNLGIGIVLVGCMFLFAYLFVNITQNYLKFLFLGVSMMFGLLSISILNKLTSFSDLAYNVQNILASALKLQTWTFRILLAGLLIYMLYYLFSLTWKKKGDYDED